MGEIKDGLAYNITEVIGNLSQVKEPISLNSVGIDRNGIDMSTQKEKDDAVV